METFVYCLIEDIGPCSMMTVVHAYAEREGDDRVIDQKEMRDVVRCIYRMLQRGDLVRVPRRHGGGTRLRVNADSRLRAR